MERARYLVSDRGRADLSAVSGFPTADPVALSTRLRAHYEPVAAAALGEQLSLRARASGRIEAPATWLFTSPGLQMMTHPLVADRRARRLATLGFPVADLTCGLGGDLRSIAAAVPNAVGVERDAVTALMAAANVPGASVLRGDAGRPPLDVARFAIVLDPSRREGAARDPDPASFSPTWETALVVATRALAAVLKGPPGIKDRDIPTGAEVEFVQVGRSLRESAFWFGESSISGLRRAVHLPSGATIDSTAPEASDASVPVGSFVFDPESCVTRAGLVRHLAARLGANLLDRHVAYLSSSTAHDSPLAAAFQVLDVVPFGVRALRNHLRTHQWRPDEIRRRAFPVEPDELRRLIGRLEGEPVALLCTTLAGKRTVIIARKPAMPRNCESV